MGDKVIYITEWKESKKEVFDVVEFARRKLIDNDPDNEKYWNPDYKCEDD